PPHHRRHRSLAPPLLPRHGRPAHVSAPLPASLRRRSHPQPPERRHRHPLPHRRGHPRGARHRPHHHRRQRPHARAPHQGTRRRPHLHRREGRVPPQGGLSPHPHPSPRLPLRD